MIEKADSLLSDYGPLEELNVKTAMKKIVEALKRGDTYIRFKPNEYSKLLNSLLKEQNYKIDINYTGDKITSYEISLRDSAVLPPKIQLIRGSYTVD